MQARIHITYFPFFHSSAKLYILFRRQGTDRTFVRLLAEAIHTTVTNHSHMGIFFSYLIKNAVLFFFFPFFSNVNAHTSVPVFFLLIPQALPFPNSNTATSLFLAHLFPLFIYAILLSCVMFSWVNLSYKSNYRTTLHRSSFTLNTLAVHVHDRYLH